MKQTLRLLGLALVISSAVAPVLRAEEVQVASDETTETSFIGRHAGKIATAVVLVAAYLAWNKYGTKNTAPVTDAAAKATPAPAATAAVATDASTAAGASQA